MSLQILIIVGFLVCLGPACSVCMADLESVRNHVCLLMWGRMCVEARCSNPVWMAINSAWYELVWIPAGAMRVVMRWLAVKTMAAAPPLVLLFIADPSVYIRVAVGSMFVSNFMNACLAIMAGRVVLGYPSSSVCVERLMSCHVHGGIG